jgi:molybdopterin-guanine dinucleotide biosynthesis protein A
LHAARYKIIDFYPRVRVNYVNEENLRAIADIDTAFFNVNTPAELARAREMVGREE